MQSMNRDPAHGRTAGTVGRTIWRSESICSVVELFVPEARAAKWIFVMVSR
jgi:hypothetical protein